MNFTWQLNLTNLNDELDLSNMIPKLDSLRDMSAGKNRFDLAKIGGESAKRQVLDDHFPNEFNINK